MSELPIDNSILLDGEVVRTFVKSLELPEKTGDTRLFYNGDIYLQGYTMNGARTMIMHSMMNLATAEENHLLPATNIGIPTSHLAQLPPLISDGDKVFIRVGDGVMHFKIGTCIQRRIAMLAQAPPVSSPKIEEMLKISFKFPPEKISRLMKAIDMQTKYQIVHIVLKENDLLFLTEDLAEHGQGAEYSIPVTELKDLKPGRCDCMFTFDQLSLIEELYKVAPKEGAEVTFNLGQDYPLVAEVRSGLFSSRLFIAPQVPNTPPKGGDDDDKEPGRA